MSEYASKHLKHEFLVGGVSNMIFNGLIAWLILRGGANLAWQGSGNFVGDVLATAFLLPLIVALIVIPLQKSKLAKGKLQVIDLGADSALQRLVNRMPDSTFLNAVLFGLTGLLIIGPLTLAGMYLVGVSEFTPNQYAVFKGIWAGLMAGVLVIPMVLIGLRERNAQTQVAVS